MTGTKASTEIGQETTPVTTYLYQGCKKQKNPQSERFTGCCLVGL